MSKVILLSGSPNSNGNTVQLFKKCKYSSYPMT